ncbi:tRNA uridine-5-carboxymethylaminomethyl(34) synthesis GTPase MnmE [Mesorhizobium sp. KR2-14]|uniref:tRNA uridine-5-carboxymethylaminomethyl(34) synthesis GTPase MnmE n=1 Tax=Mesorhizobium sp. KR2-14 TaxID=3156610 RepID=UPI0032B4553D
MIFQDTIVALSSGRLPSGIAVIRISGPQTRFALETMLGKVPSPRSARFTAFHAPDGRLLDQGIALFFPGPASFTGEDSAEFHAHGGRAVVQAVTEALTSLEGLRLAEPGEFTRRAFLNGKVDLLEAESLADLVSAETEAQRRFAVLNAEGRQSGVYLDWRHRLIHARAMIEAEMDFADEADIPGSVSSTVWADVRAMIDEIRRHVQGFHRAEIIRDGFDVVIIGAPNAGKSSLLNMLARRDVAIVTDEPGTTRDLVEVVLDLDGVKVRLTDTAGIREAPGKVEAIGIGRALERARTADLILHLEDVTTPDRIPDTESTAPTLRIGTKTDLLPAAAKPDGFDCLVSSTSGAGVDSLLDMITARAVTAVGDVADVLPSRQRHIDLLTKTTDYLEAALALPVDQLELRSENLRLASDRLGRISGAVDTEDLLDVIFSQFCIGK